MLAHMATLNLLPAEIVTEICSSFLTFIDLVRLDTAFVNSYNRVYLHESFRRIRKVRFPLIRYGSGGIGTNKINWLSRRCPYIRDLCLKDGNIHSITDESLISISRKFTALERLDLSGCWKLKGDGIAAIVGNCSNLRDINFSDCYHLNDEDVHKVAQNCSRLERINLSRCGGITELSIMAIAKYCPNLVYINLTGCHHLTNSSIKSIIESSRELRILYLAGCTGVSDDVIYAVSNSCKNLQSLHLNLCQNISDGAIMTLVKCQKLSVLEIHGCSSLTDNCVMAISNGFKSLQELDLKNCVKITNDSINILSLKRPNLLISD